jgi:hypothetical protein
VRARRQTSGEPMDLYLEFHLSSLHPIHFAADVLKFTRQLFLELIETLADVMLWRGIPEHIRSDNGPEFVAMT